MMSIRWLAVFALALVLLGGCRSAEVRIVEVPVAVPCPPPPVIERPAWRYPALTTGATTEDRARAMADDFDAAVTWGRALERALDGYRPAD